MNFIYESGIFFKGGVLLFLVLISLYVSIHEVMKNNKNIMSKGVAVFGVVFVLMMASLNLATVRKKDDPILKTQTDPILLKDKQEEIKDGEKGAPTPSFKWYAFNWFQTDSPASRDTEAINPQGTSGSPLPDFGDPLPEKDAASAQQDFWNDDNLWNFDQDDQSQPATADKQQSPDSQQKEKDWWEEI